MGEYSDSRREWAPPVDKLWYFKMCIDFGTVAR